MTGSWICLLERHPRRRCLPTALNPEMTDEHYRVEVAAAVFWFWFIL
jgi:hypothetical protein